MVDLAATRYRHCIPSKRKVCIAFRHYRLYRKNLSTGFLKSNSFERIYFLGRNRENAAPPVFGAPTFTYPPWPSAIWRTR